MSDLIVNTSGQNTNPGTFMSQSDTATYSTPQLVNQTLILKAGTQYNGRSGFSQFMMATDVPLLLTASKGGNPTYINMTVNQSTTIDDFVDSFSITNSGVVDAHVQLMYAPISSSGPGVNTVVTSVNGKSGVVTIAAGDGITVNNSVANAIEVVNAGVISLDGQTGQVVSSFSTYAGIRGYQGSAVRLGITGLRIAGIFDLDPSDTTTEDDGGLVLIDALNRRWKRVFEETIELEWFGALGDGQTIDVAAIQAAAAYDYPIAIRPDAVYLMNAPVTKNGGKFELRGTGTFKLANGVILNTDANPTNFTPLFRLQGMSYVDLGQATFDHNRQGQTYPATNNRPGRGSNPFRHNGAVEICPDATGTVPSKNIHVERAIFVNAYLNGLVLWQVSGAWIGLNTFQNTTWNGVAGAGLRNVQFYRNFGLRCGESSMFASILQPGDRSMIQIREFPQNFTTANEGIPCITTGEYAAGGINLFVDFTENYGEECGVETIFGRAIKGLTGGGNYSKNVGYGRDPNAGFYPAHIWFEICEGFNRGNTGYQDTVRAGDAQPDGMVAYSMTGNASALFPFVGNYVLDVSGGRFTSAKDANGNSISGLLYRGIRVSSNVVARDTFVDGTDNDGAYGTNFDSFENPALVIHDTHFDNSTFINTNLNQDTSVAGGPIELLRFGPSTGGVPTNISALNCTVDAGKQVIVFNGNLNNVAFPPVNVQFSNGLGAVNSTGDTVFHSQDSTFYRTVQNTYIGANAVAGFQTISNGGNQLLTGTTSSLYSGPLGVPLSAFVHASGANTGGLFVTATGGPIVARPGGSRSATLFASGRTRFGATTVDDNVNTIQTDGLIGAHSQTLETLPAGTEGSIAFASDARKVGETGAGTGAPVYYSNGAWHSFSSDGNPTTPATQVNSDWDASAGVAQILNKPTLATVATTGNFRDLQNIPNYARTVNGISPDVNGNVALSTSLPALTFAFGTGGQPNNGFGIDKVDHWQADANNAGWTVYNGMTFTPQPDGTFIVPAGSYLVCFNVKIQPENGTPDTYQLPVQMWFSLTNLTAYGWPGVYQNAVQIPPDFPTSTTATDGRIVANRSGSAVLQFDGVSPCILGFTKIIGSVSNVLLKPQGYCTLIKIS